MLLRRIQSGEQLQVDRASPLTEPIENASQRHVMQRDRFAGVAAAGSHTCESLGQEQDDLFIGETGRGIA
jgi:hypothetical protein